MRRLSPTKSLDKNKRLLTQCSNNCDLQANLGLNASKIEQTCMYPQIKVWLQQKLPAPIDWTQWPRKCTSVWIQGRVCVCEVKRVKWDFCTKMMKLTWLFNVMHRNLHTEKMTSVAYQCCQLIAQELRLQFLLFNSSSNDTDSITQFYFLLRFNHTTCKIKNKNYFPLDISLLRSVCNLFARVFNWIISLTPNVIKLQILSGGR
jgi:hypothetical protein